MPRTMAAAPERGVGPPHAIIRRVIGMVETLRPRYWGPKSILASEVRAIVVVVVVPRVGVVLLEPSTGEERRQDSWTDLSSCCHCRRRCPRFLPSHTPTHAHTHTRAHKSCRFFFFTCVCSRTPAITGETPGIGLSEISLGPAVEKKTAWPRRQALTHSI